MNVWQVPLSQLRGASTSAACLNAAALVIHLTHMSHRCAIAEGYRHIDCASFYGNEETIGEGMAEFISHGHRSELFITSKIWNDAHRPKLVRSAALCPCAGSSIHGCVPTCVSKLVCQLLVSHSTGQFVFCLRARYVQS